MSDDSSPLISVSTRTLGPWWIKTWSTSSIRFARPSTFQNSTSLIVCWGGPLETVLQSMMPDGEAVVRFSAFLTLIHCSRAVVRSCSAGLAIVARCAWVVLHSVVVVDCSAFDKALAFSSAVSSPLGVIASHQSVAVMNPRRMKRAFSSNLKGEALFSPSSIVVMTAVMASVFPTLWIWASECLHDRSN